MTAGVLSRYGRPVNPRDPKLVSCLLLVSVLGAACDEPEGAASTTETMAVEVQPVPEPVPAPELDACPQEGEGVTVLPDRVDAMERITFDLYAPALGPGAETVIGPVARRLVACPELQIEIQVHTDTRRMGSFNARQSLAIAEAIRDRLVASGVPAERLAACGYGESQPDSAEGREQWDDANNRVIFLRLPGAASAHQCPDVET